MPPRPPAPPPPCWSGRPPQSGAVQRLATFTPLRAGSLNRTPPGDELVHVQGETFVLKTAARGLHVKPDGLYNFVRTVGARPGDKHTLLSPRSSHAGLAGGQPVLYAGTIRFDSGRLDWWSNYSGTYQPVAAFRQQAGLPDERFVPWQRLQMGGIGLQRTMLAETRPSFKPERPAHTPVKGAEAPGPGGVQEQRPGSSSETSTTYPTVRRRTSAPPQSHPAAPADAPGVPSSGSRDPSSGR